MEGEKTKMTYPSSEGGGWEKIRIPRIREYGDPLGGADEILINELPGFLLERFKQAHESFYKTSNLARTVNHYCGALEVLDIFDKPTFTKFKKLSEEGEKASTRAEKEVFFKRATEFLGTLKCTKRRFKNETD